MADYLERLVMLSNVLGQKHKSVESAMCYKFMMLWRGHKG